MCASYELLITTPSGDAPVIEYGRHFTVNGRIEHTAPLPDDAVLTVRLLDGEGRTLRYARQTRKHSDSVWAYHPALTAYAEADDPARAGMKRFGFAELMVRDTAHPAQSMRDATIKCWYSDDAFKSMLVSATDRAHGAVADDGIGLCDGDGRPYTALPRGAYTVTVTLCSRDGATLATAAQMITIGDRRDQIICRFNPLSHRARMAAWSREMGISMSEDTLPGYLEPYLGRWEYHMGLLTMYRACDLAAYDGPRIHMFVYLIDPTSTSYETELGFLQSRGIVGDPERFAAYHYDIGEAVLGSGTANERQGRILRFADDEFLYVYRVDEVNAGARENEFRLDGSTVVASHTETDCVHVRAGADIAITGVVRPWQLDPARVTRRADNVYEFADGVCAIRYVFDDGTRTWTQQRPLLLQRIDDRPIGASVFEFYHLFHIDRAWRGRTLTVELTACDRRGARADARQRVRICVGG